MSSPSRGPSCWSPAWWLLVAAALILFTEARGQSPGVPAPAAETAAAGGEPATQPSSPLLAKTLFQTNSPYDPRLAIAIDGVLIHQHGADLPALTRAIASWKERGYQMGRMFFADSDAANVYWTGKWDGTPKPDEVERTADGRPVLCAGVRPYMLPTAGWTRYLEEMAIESIEAGAEGIFPEEPLAHVHTGYEEKFKELWQVRYQRPWEAESSSPAARVLTAQLKSELYYQLQKRLGQTTKAAARRVKRQFAYVFPVHSLYSNIVAHLVAPLGTSLSIAEIDGYIGQVWTGPVRWVEANTGWPEPAFFPCAYALYDYFMELVRGTGKRMWLLVDPVEDDLGHSWSDYETWYRHCVVAKLMQKETALYEVAPWPDRIFLPGFPTGGGTPAPERFRIIILSVIQAQQQILEGGSWLAPDGVMPTESVGVVVADTAMWQRHENPMLAGLFGMLLPLLHHGVPVSACLLERVRDPGYLDRFKVLVLCYENLVPADPAMHTALLDWVERGNSLIVLGGPSILNDPTFWWTQQNVSDPLAHLCDQLGIRMDEDSERTVGRGQVYRRGISPRRWVDPAAADAEYLPLVDTALKAAGVRAGLTTPGYLAMQRGPFVIANAIRRPLELRGPMIDLTDPRFPIVDPVRLEPGESGLYRDVESSLRRDQTGRALPSILHVTHRLMEERHDDAVSELVVRGPAETPGVVRVFTAGRKPLAVSVRDAAGASLQLESRIEGPTLLIRFPNVPEGATVRIEWQ